MDNIAEKPLPRHVDREHFEEVVTAVFQHHAMLLCSFGRFHQLPTFIDRLRRRYFRHCVFAVFHGIYRYWCVQIPMGADVYQINIVAFAHFFPVIFTRVHVGRKNAFDNFFSAFGFVGLHVAHGFHIYACNTQYAADRGCASTARANKGNADDVNSGRGISAHIEDWGTLFKRRLTNLVQSISCRFCAAAASNKAGPKTSEAGKFDKISSVTHDYYLKYCVALFSTCFSHICKFFCKSVFFLLG